jgi:signal transduction histidine kinase/CheY-like chemotaxis protein
MPESPPLQLNGLLNGWARRTAKWPAPFNDLKIQFYLAAGLALSAVCFATVQLSPTALSATTVFWLGVVLLLLLGAFYLGLSLHWTVYAGEAYGMAHCLYTAFHTGGLYSPLMGWIALLPVLPLFWLTLKDGLFWFAVALCSILWMGWATFNDCLPLPFVTYERFGQWVVWNYGSLMIFILVFPLAYKRMYTYTLLQSQKRQISLLQSKADLLRAQSIKDSFIASLSHELRTPMNAIMGFSELLRQEARPYPKALEVAELIKQSSEHLLTVINDILDFSLLQRGQLKVQSAPFHLPTTVKAAFSLFQQRVESMQLSYTLEIAADVPAWVATDRHRLMQVLVNLLGNAIKFTHTGEVRLHVQREAAHLLFTVSDTGIGIASERLSRVFERFEQATDSTASVYGGNGLGLSISRNLVELLGGEMGVDSQLGQGSRFWFRLPLSPCEAPAVGSQAVQSQHALHQFAARFLIVDDNPVNRLLACHVVQAEWPNAVLRQAGDGQQAVALMQAEPFDMVLMDMLMPVMDGIEATQYVRNQLPAPQCQVPILALTANVNTEDHQRCIAAGMNGLVLKPFERHQLSGLMDEALMKSPAFVARWQASASMT